MKGRLPVVVFSDVDRVLQCPGTQPWTRAAKALKRLESASVPLILCSLHTRAEIERIQQELGIHHPFVCESGGAAFLPSGYFEFHVQSARDVAGYQAIEFGRSYSDVVRTLRRTADRLRIDIVVFSDMSVEDVARECDQPLLQARLAKLREYSERFLVLDSVEKTRKRLFGALKSEGLRCIPLERYDQVGGPADSSAGVNLLRTLYERARGPVIAVGLSDTAADDSFLDVADRRVMVSDDNPAKRAIDVVDWAEAIVDIVEDLHRHQTASAT
jgi:mannosyl-3-phosphoglycerate phosphatase family protein